MSDQESKLILPRRMIQPTDEVLAREVTEAVNVLTHVWDGDVEVTVIMCRRTSGEARWATSFRDRTKLGDILRKVRKAVATAPFTMRGNKSL